MTTDTTIYPTSWPEGTWMATVNEHIGKLHERIKELEGELADALGPEVLQAGYDQCLEDMRNVTHGVIEVTWAAGPIEGLELVLRRLEHKDVPVTSPMGVPHDWLSRWKVELAP